MSSTIAPESYAAERRLPSRRLDSSEALGWRSTLVRAYADPDEADGFTTAPTPDLLVVINASGTFTIESGRSRARYRPGSAGVTAPYRSATLSWRRERTEPRRSVHIDPADDGAEVVNAVGDRVRREFYTRVGLTDLLSPA